MSVTVAIFAFVLMIGMMLLGIPIAVAMFVVGAGGGLLAFGMPFLNSAASVVWGVTLPDDGPTGGFFRDGRPLRW